MNNELNKTLEQLLFALKDYNKALLDAKHEGDALVNQLLEHLEVQKYSGVPVMEDENDHEEDTDNNFAPEEDQVSEAEEKAFTP